MLGRGGALPFAALVFALLGVAVVGGGGVWNKDSRGPTMVSNTRNDDVNTESRIVWVAMESLLCTHSGI